MDASDVEQVAGLLEAHRADMLGVAVAMLGWCPEADDAVQDASLIALAKIGQLREPAAAGPWLRSITRNVVRMRWRAQSRHTRGSGLDELSDRTASGQPTPEQVLEEHALRDWVWSSIDQLTPSLQTALLLRYFSSANSYEQIAAACGVPVGTIRSRLSAARAQLYSQLCASHGTDHDVSDLSTQAARDAQQMLAAADRGEFRRILPELTHPDMTLIGPQGQRGRGRDLLCRIMDSDQQAGVRQRLTQASSSRDVTVFECELRNPPWDPAHCPPSVLWLLTKRAGRATTIRLFHPHARWETMTEPPSS
jgi:RNA polymerase sigma-70 factor (ECF subfamily)